MVNLRRNFNAPEGDPNPLIYHFAVGLPNMKSPLVILRNILSVLFLLGVGSSVYLQSGCARIVPPQGGPKDTLPPVLIKALPRDSLLHMPLIGVKIVLNFDEYVQALDNASQNILMNPTPKMIPIYESNLRMVSVKIKDTLEPNTTYTINFGKAIKDVDEGNVLKNFTYIFSTGSYLDSGELKGRVRIAQTNKSDSTMIAILERHTDDSAVAKEIPRYVARIDTLGRFHFNNIATGTYAIYALKDNGDKRYRDKSVLFAFFDHPVTVTAHAEPRDSIIMYAYAEEGPKPKTVVKKPAPATNNKKGKAKKEEKKLHLANNLKGGKQDILSDLVLTYDQPIEKHDSTLLLLTDTFYHPLTYVFSVDTSRQVFTIKYPWPTEGDFRLIIGKQFAIDTSGVTLLKSDTLSFKTMKESDYGELTLRLKNFDLSKHPVLQFVQSDKIVDSMKVTGPLIHRDFYHPGDYELRVLFDTNNNGTWDGGSFFGVHRQPEIVIQPAIKKIRIRANGWENEYDVAL
jgi:hypothetical protein